jgi:hypothetical protein
MNTNQLRPYLAALVVALITLGFAMRSPDFATIRTVHVVQLLACGALLGISLAGFLRTARSPKPGR